MDVTQGGLGRCFGQGPGQAGAISEERSVRVCLSSRRRVAKYRKRRQQNLRDRKGDGGSPGKATREEPVVRRSDSE